MGRIGGGGDLGILEVVWGRGRGGRRSEMSSWVGRRIVLLLEFIWGEWEGWKWELVFYLSLQMYMFEYVYDLTSRR